MKCPRCGGAIVYKELKPKINFSYTQAIKKRAKLMCNSCDYEEVFT
jgi:hypothetical protein